MPGLGGGIARALGSDDVNVVSKVKNPALQKSLDSALSDYKSYTAQEQPALGDYISKYLGQQGQFEKNVGQESGAVDQFYNGSMASQLQGLRQKREAAVNAAADVGVKQGLASVNRSRLGDQGGGGSYADRLAIGATVPIRTQAALDTANQERSDLGYVTQNQLGLAGTREKMSNALASYGLTPYQTAAGVENQNIGTLSGLTNLDQANHFYGLQKPKNTFADISDSVDAGVLSAASIYSSVGGGGMAHGGLIWRYGHGGLLHGPGTTHSDSILIHASNGEFVMPASSVKMPGVLPMLQRIRVAGLASEGKHPLSNEIQMDRAGGFRAAPKTSFDDGGEVFYAGGDLGDLGGYPDGSTDAGGGGGGGAPKKPGGGGGGGGLSGEAMQLRDRAAQDQNAQWMGATMVPAAGGGGGWGMPQITRTGTSGGPPAGAMPRFDYSQHFEDLYGPEAVPSNFRDLSSPQQREYINAYARARQIEQQYPQNLE